MRSVAHRISTSLKNYRFGSKYSFRPMSSLSPGHILRGARWDYRILIPIKEDETHTSTVFKAAVIPREDVRIDDKSPPWFIVSR